MNYPPPERESPHEAGLSKSVCLGGHSQPTTGPTWPKPGTIRAQILDELLSGRSITSLDVWRELGCSRLAADVFELRRMGWPIVAAETPVTCREGRAARVASYRLDGAR